MTNHTPGPFILDGLSIYQESGKDTPDALAKCFTKRDAAFFLRAANAHDEFLALIKEVSTCALLASKPQLMARIIQALANAEKSR